MLSFNKIVNKMLKKWWKIIFKKDIFELIDPECKKEYTSKLNRTISWLRAKSIILSIKSGVYIVPDEEDKKLNSIDLLEKYFLKLLKKYITFYVWSQYYISWVKSLQFHLKDFSIPEKIYVVNRNLNKKIKVGNYEIIFKTISGRFQWKKINLYSKTSAFSKIITIDWTKLKLSGLELALIEAALVVDIEEWLQFDILNKSIKKYSKVFNTEIFYTIGTYKYTMSFNRLKEIAKPIDKELYGVFLDIIKQNGNLFIWEGLRGF